MAIVGPADLPSIMKVRSEPMKKYVLAKLGYPQIDVELTEDQFEVIWRVAGDFIAQYFPREQKLGVFWTQPLKSTYPLPKDAYWVQQVSWDPVTTRIDDVFGAESYLFCFPGGTKLLTTEGPLACEDIYTKQLGDVETTVVTPFGPRPARLRWNAVRQPIQVLKTETDLLACTPNHPVHISGQMRQAFLGYPDLKLMTDDNREVTIVDRQLVTTDGTWSVDLGGGYCYVSGLGNEFYLVEDAPFPAEPQMAGVPDSAEAVCEHVG